VKDKFFGNLLPCESKDGQTLDVFDYDFLFKLQIVGDSGTGKSSILLRFADNTFTHSFISTIGVDFKIRTLDVGEAIIKLQIWDIAGRERFRTIGCNQYRGAHGIMVVYDITHPETFANTQKWLQEIDRYADEEVSKILVGNKKDLASDRKVDISDAEEFADCLCLPFIEVSACTAENITELFVKLTMEIFDKRDDIEFDERHCRLNITYGVQMWDIGSFTLFCLNMKEEPKLTNSLLHLPKEVRQYIVKIFAAIILT